MILYPFEINLPMFAFLGALVGMLGTLVGAGGGFILVPILILLMPQEATERITAISMAVVCANAVSGTIAYARMGRVDFSAGWKFVIAALPGAFLGAVATQYVPRIYFDRTLGSLLTVIAVYLAYRALYGSRNAKTCDQDDFKLSPKGLQLGATISAAVGFISSALGIGGGIIHVPALAYVLGYPIHKATATSHFVLACTSFIAVMEHIRHGAYLGNETITITLASGAVLGAQVGAFLSKKLGSRVIIVCLATALIFVGLRIILKTI